ncbi:MAG: helix-turn-helix domain-containing protein [Syntrophobacterales bacterium]|nr:helix-turn-helix domain-containing protein [Syntrophobacterales bacterium]
MEDKNKMLTVGQVAERLNVSRSYIYRAVEFADIPHTRILRGGIRFDPQKIEEWLQKNSVEANDTALCSKRGRNSNLPHA